MARTMGTGFLLALVLSVAAAQSEGGQIPSAHSCEISVSSLDPVDFVTRALGGDVGCVDKEDKWECCDKLRGLFGWEGSASLCLCNHEFFSAMVYNVPAANDVDAERYTNMLTGCDIPVVGKTKCPGTTEEYHAEPLAQSQILGALLLARAVSGGSGGSRGGGSGGGGSPAPAPAPTPAPTPPAVPPKPLPTGGKGAKPVVLAPAGGKTAYTPVTHAPVAPAPPPQKVVFEEPVAPPPTPPPAPTPTPPAPKVTAPKVAAPPPTPTPTPPAPKVTGAYAPAAKVTAPFVPASPVEKPEKPAPPPVETPEVPAEKPKEPAPSPPVPPPPPPPPAPVETPEVPAEKPEKPAAPAPVETPEVPAEGVAPAPPAVEREVFERSPEQPAAGAPGAPGAAGAGDCQSVADVIGSTPALSTLKQLVDAAGIGGALGADFTGTVFAPNNGAIKNLLTKLELDLEILTDARSKELLTKILQLHVVPGEVLKAADLTGGQTLSTLLGGSETVSVTMDGGVLVSGPGNEGPVKVVSADIEACGSVVHIVRGVLVPSPQISSQANPDINLASAG